MLSNSAKLKKARSDRLIIASYLLILGIAVTDRVPVTFGVGLSLYRIISIFLLSGMLLFILSRREIQGIFHELFPISLIGLLFVLCFTSIFAEFRWNSLIYCLRYAEYTLITFLLAISLTNLWKPSHNTKLAAILSLSGVTSAFTVITDFWNLTSFYKIFTATRPYVRHIGILGEANYGAGKLCVLLPFTLYLLGKSIDEGKWLEASLYMLAVSIMSLAIFISGSRLAAILAVLQLMFFLFKKRDLILNFRLQLVTLILIVLFVGMGIIMPLRPLSSASHYIMKRYGVMVNFLTTGVERFRHVTESSLQERIEVTKLGLEIFANNPFSGVGVGNFPKVIGKYSSNYKGVYSHNTFLSILAETGIFGFSLFILFFYLVGRPLWKQLYTMSPSKKKGLSNYSKSQTNDNFALYMLLSFFTMLLVMIFLHDLSNKYLWTLFLPFAIYYRDLSSTPPRQN